MIKKFALLFSFITFLWACDKVDDPIPSNIGETVENQGTSYILDKSFGVGNVSQLINFLDNNNWSDTVNAPDNSAQRFITLEEFTGHTCQFCPIGTRELTRLKGIYGNQLIPIGIHAGGFAVPKEGPKYTTDFRVDGGHGEIYVQEFNQADAYPRGIVSRLGDIAKSQNEWNKDIKSIKDLAPSVILKMTNYYDPVNKIIRSNLEITWLKSLTEEYNLQVFVLEDHIIDWQLDATTNPNDIPDYDHRHVLRKVVNDTYGKTLSAAELGTTETIQYIFPFTENLVPDNDKNIEVVAFIFNSDPSSLEVIQANAAHIIKK